MNVKTICKYSQYRTVELNNRYFSILHTKIQNLKLVKNKVIDIKKYFVGLEKTQTKEVKTDYIYNLLTPKEYKLILDCYNIDLLQIGNTKNKIANCKETIRQLNKSIHTHKTNQQYKKPLFKNNVSDYDINKLNQNQTTIQINRIVTYYLKYVTTTHNKKYQTLLVEYPNDFFMFQQFKKHLTKILNNFEKKFLFSTL